MTTSRIRLLLSGTLAIFHLQACSCKKAIKYSRFSPDPWGVKRFNSKTEDGYRPYLWHSRDCLMRLFRAFSACVDRPTVGLTPIFYLILCFTEAPMNLNYSYNFWQGYLKSKWISNLNYCSLPLINLQAHYWLMCIRKVKRPFGSNSQRPCSSTP